MMRERSTAVLKSLPGTHAYPVLMLCLLVGTAIALSMRQNRVGVAGLILLALMSLTYGAVRTPEEMP